MSREKPKIYLETTLFSFYHETRKYGEYPKFRAQVREIFARIKTGEYEPYTSELVLKEITDEMDQANQDQMKALIMEYGIQVLDISDKEDRLADLYIQERALSSAHISDAMHIAITAVHGLDFIVSLNFAHIARSWTIERVRRVNKREGYAAVGIYKPAEVLEL